MVTTPYSADLANPQEAPEAEAERPRSTSRLILWLVVLALGALFLTLNLVSGTIKESTAGLKGELTILQRTLAKSPAPEAGEQSLKATLVQFQKQVTVMESVQATLAASFVDWPAVMKVIGAYDLDELVLTSITQNEGKIILAGQARDETAVMTYADTLRRADQFKRVVVQSITLRSAPTPTPQGNKAPAGPAQGDKLAGFSIAIELKAAIAAPAR
jgi:Tfp pilus assembly protein PilN